MNTLTALILGVVQGLTEFLPVSSSGHLVLVQRLIPGFSQPGIVFDVILHFGTMAAVLYYFRRKIFSLNLRYLIWLFVGTIPAVLAGVFFRDQIELMFSNPKFLGIEFLITALICFAVDLPTKLKSTLNLKNSLIIGAAQAFAIIPAISRSGATIAAGVHSGIPKNEAAEYSFLLSIPAILGANILEMFTHRGELEFSSFGNYFLGFLVALLTGFLSIGILLKLLKDNKFKIFGYYSLILGILVLVFFRG